jgi:peptidoglycan/LPS O-acetylase OafA/YrhL
MSEKNNKYLFITPLNAIRFFAAVAIVVFHFGRWSFPFKSANVEPYVLLSNTAVTLFFVLSGFIMVYVYGGRLRKTNSWSEKKYFYKARIARIVPVYLFSLAITLLYFIYKKSEWNFLSLFLQSIFFQAWVPNEALLLNFPGWSLSVEMFFYAIFPFLIFFIAKLAWKKRFAVTFLIWLSSNALTAFIFFFFTPGENASNILMKFFPLLHLNSFIIGMYAGLWYQNSKKSMSAIFAVIAILLLIADPLFIKNYYNPVQHNGLLAPLFAIIIIYVAQSKNILSRFLSLKPFELGGDASYGIYILQAPIYWWSYEVFKITNTSQMLGEEGRFFAYLFILIFCAFVSRLTLEKLSRRLILGKK